MLWLQFIMLSYRLSFYDLMLSTQKNHLFVFYDNIGMLFSLHAILIKSYSILLKCLDLMLQQLYAFRLKQCPFLVIFHLKSCIFLSINIVILRW